MKTLFEVTTDNVDFVLKEEGIELSPDAKETLYRQVEEALAAYLKEQAEELILDQLVDLMKGDKK